MQQNLFALSLGFGGLILAAHHAFAAPADGHVRLQSTPGPAVLSIGP